MSEEECIECLFIPLYAPSSSWLVRDSGKTSLMKWVGSHVINIGELPMSVRRLAVNEREFNLFFWGPALALRGFGQ